LNQPRDKAHVSISVHLLKKRKIFSRQAESAISKKTKCFDTKGTTCLQSIYADKTRSLKALNIRLVLRYTFETAPSAIHKISFSLYHFSPHIPEFVFLYFTTGSFRIIIYKKYIFRNFVP
jgi:hypothetical protein